jgi:hypothetical protein
MTTAQFILTCDAVYTFGPNGDAAPLVASDLVKDVAYARRLLAAAPPRRG